jgi:formate dehydrogenase major subunit
MTQISINGTDSEAAARARLIDGINRAGLPLSQVCYHPQLGPIQTCDTCIVEVDGELGSACAAAAAALTEAFHRILRNHELHCTVCDNNIRKMDAHETKG